MGRARLCAIQAKKAHWPDAAAEIALDTLRAGILRELHGCPR